MIALVELFAMGAFWCVIVLVPLGVVLVAVYYMCSAPLRRRERCHFLLDLIESGLGAGRSAGETVVSISRSRDESVGVRFHLLAALIEGGRRFGEAVREAHGLVSPSIASLLEVGEESGDLRRVMPACRRIADDGLSQVRGGYNYLVILGCVLLPIMPLIFWYMAEFMLPMFEQVLEEVEGADVASFQGFTTAAQTYASAQLVVMFMVYLGAVCYVGGLRLVNWVQAGLRLRPLDWIFDLLPWRRMRLQRDFSAALAAVLDAGVNERRALVLAGEVAHSQPFRRRLKRAEADLAAGRPLPEALARIDPTGELRWRFANGAASGLATGFRGALQGWLEALDAKAFVAEQRTAQALLVGLVLLNGVMVGSLAVLVFYSLSAALKAGALL